MHTLKVTRSKIIAGSNFSDGVKRDTMIALCESLLFLLRHCPIVLTGGKLESGVG